MIFLMDVVSSKVERENQCNTRLGYKPKRQNVVILIEFNAALDVNFILKILNHMHFQ